VRLSLACMIASSCFASERTEEERLSYLLPAVGTTIHWHLERTDSTGAKNSFEWFETRLTDTTGDGLTWPVLRDSLAQDSERPSISYRRLVDDSLQECALPLIGAIYGWNYVPGTDKDTTVGGATYSVRYLASCSTVAGTFQECLAIEKADSVGSRKYVYVKGIGMVYLKLTGAKKSTSFVLVNSIAAGMGPRIHGIAAFRAPLRSDAMGRRHPDKGHGLASRYPWLRWSGSEFVTLP
jgi:hypothetical protein